MPQHAGLLVQLPQRLSTNTHRAVHVMQKLASAAVQAHSAIQTGYRAYKSNLLLEAEAALHSLQSSLWLPHSHCTLII
jgi:hypothetical protein